MELSVIIPARNEEKLIEKTLRHLKRTLPKNTQIIIADGESTDKTPRIAKKFGLVVCAACRNAKHKSIAAGRNEGAKHAKGNILLFNDADTTPKKEFIQHALRIMRQNPNVVSVGCEIRPNVKDLNTQLFFSILNSIVRVSTFLGFPVIAGNCVFYRKSAFKKVNGFNESMFASEDQDLSARMSKIGKVILLTEHTAYTSNRRLEQEGWIGLMKDWSHTTINFLLGKNTKNYASFR